MTFIDDAARDAAASSITQFGLATADGVEVTGSGYARLTPTWSSGSLTAPLAFTGPANTQVTHAVLSDGVDVVYRAFGTAKSFNSDGKINVTSYTVSATTGA